MEYPLCFESKEQFETWVEVSTNDGHPDPRLSFCDYCTVAYQKAMTKEGRCQNPNFVIDEEKEDIVDGESWNQVVLISG